MKPKKQEKTVNNIKHLSASYENINIVFFFVIAVFNKNENGR